MSFSQNIKWSPEEYASMSVLAQQVGEDMLERLSWMTHQPKVILDIGSGTGETSLLLQNFYPNAKVIALDLCELMTQHTSNKLTSICADSENLPFENESIDCICANFFLPWHPVVQKLFPEWQRVLRPNGLLMLTALGPDTLREWHNVFALEDCVPVIDMHDLGDLMLKSRFVDPVLDLDYYTLTYREKKQLIKELKVTGMLADAAIANEENIPALDEEGKLNVTFEVIFAHAFKALHAPKNTINSKGEISIPLESLKIK